LGPIWNRPTSTARIWKGINPGVTNTLGEPVGYRFLPGDNSFPFASPNAWWRKRAGFVNHHVWVTPYRADEKYAAGDYPNQNPGGDGLPRWTATAFALPAVGGLASAERGLGLTRSLQALDVVARAWRTVAS